MQGMQVDAAAKINLSLSVLRKRDDGFHEIETVVAPITLSDRLSLSESNAGIHFTCDDPTVPTGADNLVVLAAMAWFNAAQREPALSIHLEKHIPHGAGLGGGSSDAAATLLALNRGGELSREKLLDLAAALGSDVPMFLHNSAATCRGRGEKVERLAFQAKLPLLLMKPQFAVPTPWAYSRWSDSAELSDVNYATQSLDGQTFVNDLERPVFEKYLFLAEIKMWLLRQPEVAIALLSGSGSTVFAVLRDAENAETLAGRAREELDSGLWTHACETR